MTPQSGKSGDLVTRLVAEITLESALVVTAIQTRIGVGRECHV